MKNLKNIKLILSDFDHTLTNTQNKISDNTIASIKRFINLGGIFGIATGRSLPLMKNRLPELELHNHAFPLVTYQGAVIANSKGEIYQIKSMKHKTVLKVVKYLEDNHQLFHISTLEQVYAIEDIKTIKTFVEPDEFSNVFIFKPSIYDFLLSNKDLEVIQISLICDPNKTDIVQNNLNQRFINEVLFVKSHPRIIESTEITTSKGNALSFLTKAYNLSSDEVLVFGDSLNDLSMFETPVIKVAVENASSILKEKADYICGSCDDSGVARFINQICQLKEIQ